MGWKIHDELVLECPACEEDLDRLKARDTRPSLGPSAYNAARVSEMFMLPKLSLLASWENCCRLRGCAAR